MTKDQIDAAFDHFQRVLDVGRECRPPIGTPGVGSSEFVKGYDKGLDDAIRNVRSFLKMTVAVDR